MKLLICLEIQKNRKTNGYYLADEFSQRITTEIVYGQTKNLTKLRFFSYVLHKLRIPFFFEFYNIRIILKTLKFDPDIILIIKGNYVWPWTLLILKFLKKEVSCCSNDNYRFRHNRSLFLEYSLSLYDKIFYHKPKDKDYLTKFKNKDDLILLIHSYSPKYHFPDYIHHRSEIEILFIGTCENYRDSLLANLALDGYKMHVQGTRWQNSKLENFISKFNLKNCTLINKNTSETEYRNLISSSKIVLNFFRRQNEDEINSRIIESLACSAICLCEYSQYVYEIFKKDNCINFFKDEIELKNQIKIILDLRSDEISKLRKNSLEAVQKKNLDFYSNFIRYLK